MASVLGDKDINASMEQQTQQQSTKDVKSMDYHRQMLQSKIAEEPYVTDKAAKPVAVKSSFSACSSSSSSLSSVSFPASRSDSTNSNSNSHSTDDAKTTAPTTIMVMPRWPTNTSFASRAKQYVSPSDNIMSPCSAKISALRNKQVNKYVCSKAALAFSPQRLSDVANGNLFFFDRAKPKSLFAQASAKKLNGDNIFGAKDVPKP